MTIPKSVAIATISSISASFGPSMRASVSRSAIRCCAQSCATAGSSSERSGNVTSNTSSRSPSAAKPRTTILGVTAIEVAAGHQRLRVYEDPSHLVRRDRFHLDAVERDHHVGQDGRRDALEQPRHLAVDTFLGRHVVARADEPVGQLVEQHRVDIEADTEGEELRAFWCSALDGAHDRIGVGDARCRQAVGQEDDGARAVTVEE